jgi:short-subunit dehydrogenase
MIIPLLVRRVATAAAAASSLGFLVMDCNPELYVNNAIGHMFGRSPSFAGKGTIWIIGSSSGIGEELAYRLSSSADHLILSARSTEKLQAVASQCHPNCQVDIIPLDVTKQSSDKDWQETLKRLPVSPDIVILNAGKGHLSPATETTSETAWDMLRTNAAWIMILVPQLVETHQVRHIVVTSSVAGILPVPLSAAYAASKHAVMGYMRSFQAERPDVRIDLICPGPVDTNFHSSTQQTTTKNLKMSQSRCVDLMMTDMARPSAASREVWIAQQPTLTALYLQQFAPGLLSWILQRVGPKRVDIWRQGLDLYDPKSWRTKSSKGKEQSR